MALESLVDNSPRQDLALLLLVQPRLLPLCDQIADVNLVGAEVEAQMVGLVGGEIELPV